MANQKIFVAGAGTMGNSITLSFAMGGYDVTMYSRKKETLDHAKELMKSSIETCANGGLVEKSKTASILGKISYTQSVEEGAKGAILIIETIAENPDVKKEFYKELEKFCAKDTIIASNTSALNIYDFAEMQHPERLIIAHYFSPAHIIPLVEIVPGPKTSQETIAKTKEILLKTGKSPVMMKKYGPGFIVNRIQRAIGETCMDMVQEGLTTPEEIDNAIKNTLGIRLPIVGVMQTFDFQGLDMLLSYQKNVGKVYNFVEDLVKQGRNGAKSSKGIYDYQGRKEVDILKKRDELFIKMMEFLKSINAFKPV